jgi:hypothetical protein
MHYGQNTKPREWPWHAAVYWNEKSSITFVCGGSFVHTRTVITGKWVEAISKHDKSKGKDCHHK